ncbi:MAG: OmpH family outer membrane protein [Kiritimatiellaeota bacterium]|nr:OmpH family outer membrane protein [Kiritimatiellota bacterium]
MKKAGMMLAVALAAMTGIAQEKTVVVNMIDLVRFHPRREQDRKRMEDREKEYQAQLDKKRNRFEELREDYEKLAKEARNPALSEKARNEKEEQVTKQRNVLAEFDQDLRKELQDLQRKLADLDTELLRIVTDDIREAVTKYAKDNKIAIIMDGSTLAYFDLKLDMTDEVLKKMGVDPQKARKEAEAGAK